MQNIETNKIVAKWLEEHCPDWRIPIRSEGSFQDFAKSKTAACWGQPVDGVTIKGTNIKISVCQPSKQSKNDQAYFLYDYILI